MHSGARERRADRATEVPGSARDQSQVSRLIDC
jgi:hypothetical protein